MILAFVLTVIFGMLGAMAWLMGGFYCWRCRRIHIFVQGNPESQCELHGVVAEVLENSGRRFRIALGLL